MEDPFTSVQLDRGDESKVINSDTIDEAEENVGSLHLEDDVSKDDEPSDSLLVSEIHNQENDVNVDTVSDNKDIEDIAAQENVLSMEDDNGPATLVQDESNAYEYNDYFDKYQIEASISDPIRDIDQASKPFISYLITTTSNNPSLIKLTTLKDETDIKISVRRRYGDFRNLYHCLTNDFPAVLIPPLPSKLNLKYLTGDTFSQEFVHKRLNSLNRFIKFINNHKYLSQLSVYHLFLSDSNDWLSFSKSVKITNINDVEKEQSFTSSMVNRVVNEELITETVMNFLTPSKHKKETNKEILEISDKLKKMYENLIKLDKIFGKLNKKNNDLSVDYNLFLSQIEKLSVINESSNVDFVSVNENFKFFSECLKKYLDNWSHSYKFINESFLTSLKDCSKYIISLTNLIELQHNKKIDLQVLQEYLDKAKAELSTMPSSSGVRSSRVAPPSPIKNKTSGIVNNTTQLIKDTLSTSASGNIGSSNTESKKQKLEAKITQLEEEVENQTNLVQDLISKIIYEEYPNWDKFNKTELKSSMLDLCDNQIEFYKGLVDDWNETESKLMKRINELG